MGVGPLFPQVSVVQRVENLVNCLEVAEATGIHDSSVCWAKNPTIEKSKCDPESSKNCVECKNEKQKNSNQDKITINSFVCETKTLFL